MIKEIKNGTYFDGRNIDKSKMFKQKPKSQYLISPNEKRSTETRYPFFPYQ